MDAAQTLQTIAESSSINSQVERKQFISNDSVSCLSREQPSQNATPEHLRGLTERVERVKARGISLLSSCSILDPNSDWNRGLPPKQVKKEPLEEVTTPECYEESEDANSLDMDKDGVQFGHGSFIEIEVVSERTEHIKEIKEERDPNGFQCHICDKSYAYKASLKKHLTTHQMKKIKCTLCKKTFPNQYNLKLHMMIHSTQGSDRPYMCNVCGKTFCRVYHMVRHQKTHTNERSHVCEVCGKAFRERHDLKKHHRTHTQERPYQCPFCQKWFRQTGVLRTHIRIHTNEKPYECSICHQKFAYYSGWKLHKKCHSCS